MLPDHEIAGTIDRSRDRLAEWAEAVAKGTAPSTIAISVRMEHDLLVSLLDESSDLYHEQIHYLLNRCDALAARLVN